MLFDREREKHALDRLLAAVRQGLSGAFVLRGEAGIGKTALLEYAIESAGDMQVARVTGVESEVELPFAGLHQLLIPFLAGLERLPAPQREALGSAFGLVAGVAPDRFLVGLGVLTLLADAAFERPVLCVFDDAQWIDKASSEALGFVARRLLADPVAMLFAVREPSERTRLEGLAELRVGGLPDADALGLLASVAAGRLDDRVGERIVWETQGNPLALVELARELTPGELSGESRLPEPLPIGRRLEERYLRRISVLPRETQTLLLLASAQHSGDLSQLWRAAEHLGIGAEAAEPAVGAGLLVLAPRVAFSHPLIRSAVYQGASPAQRRRAHEALAAASDPERDPDRRAWHRAEATVAPDEDVAAELERSADRARVRGSYAAAAASLTRAADLTPDERRCAARRLHAAQAELAAGSPSVAAGLLKQATPWLADPLERAEARRLEARVHFAGGECDAVPAMLLEAARALKPLDVLQARETLMEAFEAALYAGRDAGEGGTRMIARVAREMPRPARAPESPLDVLLDGVTLLDRDYPAGARLLQRGIRELLEEPVDRRESPKFNDLGCTAAGELQDDEALQALTAQVLKLARDRGDLMAMLPALGWQVLNEALSGRFAAAEAALTEGHEIAHATGNVGVFGEAGIIGLPILAWRGEEAATRHAAEATTREVLERGMAGRVNHIRAAVTSLELALANYQAAFDATQAVFEEDPIFFGTAVLPDLIEAASRIQEGPAARAALRRLSERSLASGTELALGLLARSRALLSEGEEAERLYAEAIEHLEMCRTAPELARAHLLYGEWLRRQRRRRDSREELRTALELFESMGAEAFAERARVELLATGEHARKRAPQDREELTPQEIQVARLASEGASNREIAAQLFISSSTVAYHLRKVFRKLSVSNRTQLAHSLPPQSPRPRSDGAISSLRQA
ncbi:MAG TPA: LuxR C-terminal-related transcriptional regulator [Solirubrobacteraceae bacterium]|nr:LuxR C-terminal-related transcriptional regulator [Solirubrobacteraceae bacterium]